MPKESRNAGILKAGFLFSCLPNKSSLGSVKNGEWRVEDEKK
jgi:hypothetical protein